MIKYKIDILDALKAAGYTTYRLRKDKILGETTISKLRAGEVVGPASLDTLCRILKKQPGDLIKYTPDDKS